MPTTVKGVDKTVEQIKAIYKRRRKAAVIIAEATAREAEADFKSEQQAAGIEGEGRWWTNRTGKAADMFRAMARRGRKYIGFELQHLVPYAIYLEFTHNRRALRDLSLKWGLTYFARVRRVFGVKPGVFTGNRGGASRIDLGDPRR